MRQLLRALLVAGCLAYPGARLIAHVRLIHPANGNPLRWSNAANVGIVIHAGGSDDIPDGSHETALRLAVLEWNAVTATTATLVEDASSASQARTDWVANDVHAVLFDENNSSGFFPAGSSTVAITPVWFYSNGVIEDADVLFNGLGYRFTTSGEAGRFDVQDVATHELGHLLGLDHSGAVGASLYPYVDRSLVLHRSLSRDDVTGLRDVYPAGAGGRITGTIRRTSDASFVSGAYVVATDAQGRTAASVLANPSGAFTLRELDPGTYTVYARPLDTPVSEGNLGFGYSGGIETDFEPAFYPAAATIADDETVALGVLGVGPDVALSLGTSADRFPRRIVAGESQYVLLHGVGLASGSTLEASDPDLVLGPPIWSGSRVTVQVTVPAGEPSGHVDLKVTDPAGGIAVLPAGLEVTPPSPAVSAVQPGAGPMQGGTLLTIEGSGFHPGLRVVVGDQIYSEGVNATRLDEATLQLTTSETIPGAHDVVVIDASGVEGRLVSGFTAQSAPAIARVFPGAGAYLGGTEVVLQGTGFLAGPSVRIDGVDQGPVAVEGGELARFATLGGPAGGPYLLELVNLDGSVATSAFSYASQPDPAVASVAPASGSAGGGEAVTIHGSGFTAAALVYFGTDADTGAGGTPAARVTFVDAGTLEVETPAHAGGPASVLVVDGLTGQGATLAGAFTFLGGGGGGGCHTLPVPGPPRAREILASGGWIALVLLLLRARARRTRPAATSG